MTSGARDRARDRRGEEDRDGGDRNLRVQVRSFLLVVVCVCACAAPVAPRRETVVVEDDVRDRARWDERMAALRENARVPAVGESVDVAVKTCESDRGELKVEPRDNGESEVRCSIGGVEVFSCHIADRVPREGGLPEPLTTSCRSTRSSRR